ncbi:hypothetical protein JHW43_004408 [Diplocarpon mali]|nr:hypothetical protein JHW43_004408 [Diplocarpon mali]
MDNSNANSNRFYLNLNNDRSAFPDRSQYPTTPSTFPNPIFSAQANGGQQGQAQTAHNQQSQQQQQQAYGAGYAPSGFFMNNPYPPNYPQQPPPASSGYQQAPQAPQATYQQRPAPLVDTTNGLAHQFSHQNLGGGRQSPYGSRQPSPGQRPRTAGAGGQQSGYNSYLNAPMPAAPQQQNWPEFQPAPERNPDKYGPLTHTNQKKCGSLAEAFFKDSVKRARDRNVRQSEMEQRLADVNQSQSRREQTWIRAPFEPKLSSNVDTAYFPIDEIDQTDNATHLKQQNAASGGAPRIEAPEMSLPFIGYTFKRFDDFNKKG